MSANEQKTEWDFSGWIAEKADRTLHAACALVDWFRSADLDLDDDDRATLRQEIYEIIRNAAKVSSYGHKNLDAWSFEWVEAMVQGGKLRYDEYMAVLDNRAIDTTPSPSKLPISLSRQINAFKEIQELISNEQLEESQVRGELMRLAHVLLPSPHFVIHHVGDRLLALIDAQVVDIAISWDEFLLYVTELLDKTRGDIEKVVDEASASWI